VLVRGYRKTEQADADGRFRAERTRAKQPGPAAAERLAQRAGQEVSEQPFGIHDAPLLVPGRDFAMRMRAAQLTIVMRRSVASYGAHFSHPPRHPC
jgi:hypothetical protein